MANRIQLRRDTAANWTRVNPVLEDGEPGLEIDTNRVKYGDGNTVWTGLAYAATSGSTLVNGAYSVSLGNTGTVTLPAGGTISEGVVTSNPTIQLTPANPDVASQKLVIKGGGGYSNTENGIYLSTNDITYTVSDSPNFYVYDPTRANETLYWWIVPEEGGISTTMSGTVELDGNGDGVFNFTIISDAYEFRVRVSPTEDTYDPQSIGVESVLINGDAPSYGDYHLHLTTGDLTETSIFLGTDDHNVRTTTDGKIQITTFVNSYTVNNVWEFDTNGNLTLPNNGSINFSNGVNILSTVGAGTYSNATVASYLLEFDGDIEFTSSTARIGNVDVITVMDSIRSPAYQFSNGVSILSNLAASTGDITFSGSDITGLGTNVTITADTTDYVFYSNGTTTFPATGNITAGNLTIAGSLTFPSNLIIGSNPLGSGTIISQANAEITVATTGNAATYIGWSEFEFEPGNIALVAFNDTTGAVAIQTGATTGPEAFNEWIFDADGTLTFPIGGNLIFDSSATSVIDGVTSITANGNVTATQYNFANGVNIFDTITGVTSISTSVTTETYSDATGDFSYGLLGYSYAVNGVTNSFEIQYSAPLAFGNVDINVGNVTTTGTANVANLIISGSAPSTLSGSAGDRAGMVRVDSNYIYYCTSTFASNVYTVGWGGAVSNTLFLTQGSYPTPQVGWIVSQGGYDFTIDTISDDGYGSWQITWVGTPYGSPTGGNATLTNPTPLSAIWKTVPLSAFQTAANATNKLTNGGSEVALQANGVTTFGNTATISNNGEFRLWADNDITVYRNGQDGYGVKAGSVEIFTNNGQRTVITSAGLEIKTGNLIIPNDKAVVFANGVNILSDVVSKTTGTWTVTTGTNTYSFTVPASGTYQLWVDCNIPNGIIAYNATATVTNSNVPVVGAQYAWVYNGGGTPIDFVSIPNQFIGTANTIVRSNTAPSATTNRFDFGINNTSGGNVTVTYGYIKIS